MVGTMEVRSRGSKEDTAMVAVATGIALAVMGRRRVGSMALPRVARASIHRRVASLAVPTTTEHPAGLGTVMGSTLIIRDMATATAGVVTSMAMATSIPDMATGMGHTWAKVSMAGRGRSSLAVRVSPHTLEVKARRIHVTNSMVVSARSTSAHHTVVGIRAKARSISGIRGSSATRRAVVVGLPPCAARGEALLLPSSRVAMSAAPKVDALSIKPSAVPPGIGWCEVLMCKW